MRRLLFVLVLLGLAGGGFLFYSLGIPYKGFDKDVIVDFPPRTSTAAMARTLSERGVIRSEWQFLMARALSRGSTLQAGEYKFSAPASVWTVFQRIVRGDVFYYELRVPEGSNQFDIATALDELGVIKGREFLKAASNPAMIRDLAPKAPTLEGYLFPATYRLTKQTTAQQLTKEMTDRFRRAWKSVSPAPGTSVHDAVTLASLVEKETAVASERPMVASVFRNRLDRGMTLDCDPTTIYAAMLEDRYRGTIHRSDLDSKHAYNTYRNAGLPPGPIANPGTEAIKAALTPADTPYLFFVAKADGTGAHNFTTTLAEHTAAVQSYRRNVDAQKRQ